MTHKITPLVDDRVGSIMGSEPRLNSDPQEKLNANPRGRAGAEPAGLPVSLPPAPSGSPTHPPSFLSAPPARWRIRRGWTFAALHWACRTEPPTGGFFYGRAYAFVSRRLILGTRRPSYDLSIASPAKPYFRAAVAGVEVESVADHLHDLLLVQGLAAVPAMKVWDGSNA